MLLLPKDGGIEELAYTWSDEDLKLVPVVGMETEKPFPVQNKQ